MTSQGNSDNQTKIGPENGLECVKSVDSGQPVEVIPNFTIWEVSEAQLLKVIPRDLNNTALRCNGCGCTVWGMKDHICRHCQKRGGGRNP